MCSEGGGGGGDGDTETHPKILSILENKNMTSKLVYIYGLKFKVRVLLPGSYWGRFLAVSLAGAKLTQRWQL